MGTEFRHECPSQDRDDLSIKNHAEAEHDSTYIYDLMSDRRFCDRYAAKAAQVFRGKQTRMAKHILVTNDDGVFAPGLLALVEEMRKLGRVTVLAPDRNWSGGGHVKTLDRALRVKEVRLAD